MSETRYTRYDPFAWFYDQYWGHDYQAAVLPVVEQRLLARLPPGARILDLCCGSGHTAEAIAARGFEIVGVDGSAAMLERARLRLPAAELVVADARSFELSHPAAAAVCLFDSLNHLLEPEDLGRVFGRLAHALAPKAPLLADLNTEVAFASRWSGSHGIVHPDAVCVARGTYDPARRLGRCELTLLRRDGPEVWRRSDLTIEERAHPPEEVRAALEGARFTDIQIRDGAHDLGMPAGHGAGRLFFSATAA